MKITFEDSSISSLAILDTLILAGTAQGLFLSRNGGEEWLDVLELLGVQEAVTVTSLLCLPEVILAGVGGGLLRSADQGLTWQFIEPASPAPVINALARGQDGRLYAGSAQDGIFYSVDGGQKWVRWNFGLLDGHVFALACAGRSDGGETVYAGTETGIFQSTNQGRTWREVDFPLEAGAVLGLAFQPGPQGGWLYAGSEEGGLLRSADAGRTWERIGQDIFPAEPGCLCAGEGWLLAGGESGLWASADQGQSWQLWCELAAEEGALSACAAPLGLQPGETLYLGSTAGVLFTLPAPLI